MPDILRGGLSVACVRVGALLRNVVWNTLLVSLDAAHLPYGVQQFLCSVHRQRGVSEEVQHIDSDGICWKNAAEEYRFCRLHRR